MQTPKNIAEEIIQYISLQIPIQDSILEPFLGQGNIYKEILNKNKFFCDTKNGINFFDWEQKVDWAVSNPPFQILQNGEPINAFVLIINRLMTICNKGFFLLINHKLWSSLTVKRLNDWNKEKWVISRIKIFEIKQWYGRYYLIKFEKGVESLLDFNIKQEKEYE